MASDRIMKRSLSTSTPAFQDDALARAWEVTLYARRRRTRFRAWMLLLAISLMCLFLFLGIAVSRWFLLVGMVLSIPGYTLFVLLDRRHLWQWRSRMLQLWFREGLHLPLLGKRLQETPDLNLETRQSLLKTLEECEVELPSQPLSDEATRRELAKQLQTAIHRSERRTVTATVSFSLMLGLGFLSMLLFSGPLLLAASLAGGLWWLLRAGRSA
jgi:hypothetical protein